LQWWKARVQDHIINRSKQYVKVHHILLIPGDISHQMEVMEKTFIEAKRGYDDVFFIPGNHEMWCTSRENYSDSLEKTTAIIELCQMLGIFYYPVYYPNCNLLIAPIWSWYHASWDTTLSKLNYYHDSSIPFELMWTDFRLCKWPSSIEEKSEIASLSSKSTKLATYFASFNEPWLQRYLNGDEVLTPDDNSFNCNKELEIISLSHFVPLQELIPGYLNRDEVRKVSGSNPLKEQLARLKPSLHVFGHTHLPVDKYIRGVRYLQWSLGTHLERSMACWKVDSHGPLCVYDTLSKGLLH